VSIKAKASSLLHSSAPFLFLVAVWQIGAIVAGPQRCPDIGQTVTVFFETLFHDPIIEAQGGGSGGFVPHVIGTFLGVLGGFTGGAMAGFVLALCMVQFRILTHLLEPALEFGRALPPLLVIPFAILLCKSNDALQGFTVAVYASFSICIYTLNAVRNIAPNYLYLAKLLGASKLRSVFDVQIPAVMPEVLGALRVTAPLSLGICVVVEYLAAAHGLGRVMKFAISYSRVDLIMVSIVWVILIGLVIDLGIASIFSFTLRWTRRDPRRS
jgi:ABC-type nitrate/sulfonate/bicarbonate transport system permease component